MKTLKLICYFIIAICFLGCAKDAKQSIKDGDFIIEFLFEKDGCKMYRFSDSGRYIYWTNCEGKTQYNYTQSAGKSRTTKRVESVTSK